MCVVCVCALAGKKSSTSTYVVVVHSHTLFFMGDPFVSLLQDGALYLIGAMGTTRADQHPKKHCVASEIVRIFVFLCQAFISSNEASRRRR